MTPIRTARVLGFAFVAWVAVLAPKTGAAPQAAPSASSGARVEGQASARAHTGLTALDKYVAAPDPAFAWKALRDLPAEGVKATLLEMTSQRWLTEK